jgi:uncharacterized protein YcbK (DUF882 family)
VNLRRLFLVCAVALGLTAAVPALDTGHGSWTRSAEAKGTSKSPSSPAKKKSRRPTVAKQRAARLARMGVRSNETSSKIKQCSVIASGKKKRRRCTFIREFQGHGVAGATLRAEPLDHPSGDVWVNAENLNEEARVNIFKPDGTYDETALATLDDLFRCKRTNEVRAVDPRLYEQLSRIYDHFGGKRIELVSGFRFAERNSSRHFHASAMDIRIKGVTIKEMYAFAESLDGGGMGIGIYPNSGFIHVDFRAPGEPSYRWTDYSGAGSSARARNRHHHKQSRGRVARAKRPTS